MRTVKNHVGSFQIKSEISATVESVITPSEDYIEPVFDPQVINNLHIILGSNNVCVKILFHS